MGPRWIPAVSCPSLDMVSLVCLSPLVAGCLVPSPGSMAAGSGLHCIAGSSRVWGSMSRSLGSHGGGGGGQGLPGVWLWRRREVCLVGWDNNSSNWGLLCMGSSLYMPCNRRNIYRMGNMYNNMLECMPGIWWFLVLVVV